MSNPGNVVGGHKANLNNPNTSEESKEHSREVIDNVGQGADADAVSGKEKNPKKVAGGLISTINNPNIPEDTKKSAAERLEKMGET